VLLVVSFVWDSDLGPQPNWTEDQAEELAEAQVRYHQLGHRRAHATRIGPGGPPDDDHVSELSEAKQHFEQMDAALRKSVARHAAIGGWIRWTGIGLILVGGFIVLIVRSGD
jgi:hypothetical protein